MSNPFFSIVTISYNQHKYLKLAMDSVLSQDFKDYEYIVQDPGSTDGSRELIDTYTSCVISNFECDEGPADGLNKGFARASGKFYLYLNSDDLLLPGSLGTLYNWINKDSSSHDVYSGGAIVIDGNGKQIRYAYPDRMSLARAAYGQCILIQPSSAIKASAFANTGGFNSSNYSNWDGELFIDLALNGSKFIRSSELLSCYRVHAQSITGSGRLMKSHINYNHRMFDKISAHLVMSYSPLLHKYYWIERKLFNPLDTFERILHGPIFCSV